MSKYNLLTTLSMNAAGLTAGLSDATKATAGFASNAKAQNASITDSFKDISAMGIGEMKRELMRLKNISFAGKTKEDITAINKEIGKLTDEMGDLRSKQKMMGVEMGSAMAAGLQTMAAMAEVGLGVASMFGVSKEAAEGFQRGMTTLIGVTQGLGVIEDALATNQLKNIALRIQSTVVTAAQTVATSAATAAQWLYNASLLVVIGTIGIVVVAVAAVVAGVYFLVKAFSDSDDSVDESKTHLDSYNDAHKRLAETMATNQLKIADLQKQNLVSTGQMTQKEYDIWSLNEARKLELKKNASEREASMNALNGEIAVNMVGASSATILELQKTSAEARLKIINEFGANSVLINAKYAAQLDLIKNGKPAKDTTHKTTKKLDYSVSETTKYDFAKSEFDIQEGEKAKAVADARQNADDAEMRALENSGEAIYDVQKKNSDRLIALKLTEVRKTNKIEQYSNKEKAAIIGDSFGQIAGLFDENTLAYKAMAITQATISTWLAAANILANTAKLGPIAMGLSFAATVATGMMTVGKIAGAFANGGIIGGNSYSGDNVFARVNSGEMILNQSQQGRLFDIANGGGSSGGEVTFRIQGSTLVGVLSNHNRKLRNTA